VGAIRSTTSLNSDAEVNSPDEAGATSGIDASGEIAFVSRPFEPFVDRGFSGSPELLWRGKKLTGGNHAIHALDLR
jgi:hypothetical protein